VKIAIPDAQIILAFIWFGVVAGSVIMKKLKSNKEPFMYLCSKTSISQP
jgi:hypothetical protein